MPSRLFREIPCLSSLALGLLVAVILLTNAGCSGRGKAVPEGLTATSHSSEPDTDTALSGVASAIRFEQLPTENGLCFTYKNGAEADQCSILETLGGGVAALDYDGDGWLDLCFPGGGKYVDGPGLAGLPTGLFRNLGSRRWQDVSANTRIKEAPYYSHGACVGDFNNDGFPDVLITGYGGVLLWQNLGDGTFIEVAKAAGIDDPLWSSSAAWGDLNGDGVLDLYLAHYLDWSFKNHPYCKGPKPDQREICTPHEFAGVPDKLLFGKGDGTFRDASAEAGLRTDASGKGLGVVLGDLDIDGDLDIYVANDAGANHLYLNDGSGNLAESGLLRGVALDDAGVANGSMGVDLCDYNGDGLPDLWVANYEDESFALYRNEGQGMFLHVSKATGITALGGMFVGFGTFCADLDRDGDEDILVTNGHVLKYPLSLPVKQLPLALENRDGRFARLIFPAADYFSTPQEGRGMSVFDLDNDGDLDAAISHLNAPATVLMNETVTENGWIAVRLVGVASNRGAVGARLVLHTSAGDQVRQIKGGGGYLSQGDPRAYWGLPKGVIVKGITVHWPSGRTQSLDSPSVNRQLTLVESR